MDKSLMQLAQEIELLLNRRRGERLPGRTIYAVLARVDAMRAQVVQTFPPTPPVRISWTAIRRGGRVE